MLSKLKGIDIAFYIFLLTGLGYLITYLYEWGFNSYFSIPVSFITLSVPNITKTIAILGAFFSIIILNVIFFEDKTDLKNLVNKLISIKPSSNKKYNFTLQAICMIAIFYFLYLWKNEEQANGINYLGVCLLLFISYCILKKYEKLILASWITLMFMLPYMIGVTTAMKQDEFYIIDNKTNYLIISFYDDMAIAAKFEKKKKIVYQDFKLISVDKLEENKKVLKLVKINKLKISKASTIQ